MKLAIILFAGSLFGQTAKYPGAIVTDSDLGVVRDGVQSSLNVSATSSATSLTVASGAKFLAGMIVTVEGEQIKICNVVGNVLSVGSASCPNVDGRGFAGTTAASHTSGKLVSLFVNAWNHNALKVEVQAVQSTLGVGLANIAAVSPAIQISSYDWTPQAPGGSLTGGVTATIALAPCPRGIAGTNPFPTRVRLWGGTGAAETALIAGGTCTSGASTGTIIVTPANSHSGLWAIASASSGIQEAVNTHSAGGTIAVPVGTTYMYGKVSFGADHQFVGSGNASFVDATTMFDTSAPAFEYLSGILGIAYDVVSSVKFSDFFLSAKNGIKVNARTIPSYQANVLRVTFEGMRINGVYAGISDANKYTATVPSVADPTNPYTELVAELSGYGIGIECNQCYRLGVNNNQIENFGIGVRHSGDESYVTNSRLSYNGSNIYFDSRSSGVLNMFGGNNNTIAWNKIAANVRKGGIILNGGVQTYIQNNYFENYCPSAQFIRSYAGASLKIISNRIDSPNNSSLCGTGATNTTPIFDLDDYYGDEISSNFMYIGPNAPPPMVLRSSLYDYRRPNIYHVHDNSPSWPEPDAMFRVSTGTTYPSQPTAVVGDLNPLLFRASNVGGSIIGYTSMPWTLSSLTALANQGKYVLTSQACCWGSSFYLPQSGFTEFALRVTGRKTGTGVTFIQAVYVGTGSTTVFSGNKTITATAEMETATVYLKTPAGERTNGSWAISVDNAESEIEQIEVVPIDEGLVYGIDGVAKQKTHSVSGRCTLGTDCAVTLTGAAAFTSGSTYSCTATDQTAAAAVKIVNTSGSVVTFTGTGADVISYICVGY